MTGKERRAGWTALKVWFEPTTAGAARIVIIALAQGPAPFF